MLCLSLAAVVVGLAVGLWLLSPRTAITRDNATRIREGMTLASVEVVLGGPARDESTGPVVVDLPRGTKDEDGVARLEGYNIEAAVIGAKADVTGSFLIWRSDRVFVWVRLDSEQRVERAGHCPVCRQYESPIAIVCRWLRL
jgi:hypothetical protein